MVWQIAAYFLALWGFRGRRCWGWINMSRCSWTSVLYTVFIHILPCVASWPLLSSSHSRQERGSSGKITHWVVADLIRDFPEIHSYRIPEVSLATAVLWPFRMIEFGEGEEVFWFLRPVISHPLEMNTLEVLVAGEAVEEKVLTTVVTTGREVGKSWT